VVAELKRLQIYDSTLIVLTSDHGEEFGDHDPTEFYDRHGHTLYEELIRVPLIIKLPRQRHGGSRVTRLTRIIDVMPTVLDVVGVEGHPPLMQGVSLRSLWGEGDASFPGAAVSEALATRAEKKSIRTDRHKLVISIAPKRVKDHGRGSIPAQVEAVQLFDLELDPRETENLLIDPILPQTLELAADLEARLRQAVAPHRAKPEKTILDLETVERLRGLGYLEE
jgi:arylsulfatase A-like enzyme